MNVCTLCVMTPFFSSFIDTDVFILRQKRAVKHSKIKAETLHLIYVLRQMYFTQVIVSSSIISYASTDSSDEHVSPIIENLPAASVSHEEHLCMNKGQQAQIINTPLHLKWMCQL